MIFAQKINSNHAYLTHIIEGVTNSSYSPYSKAWFMVFHPIQKDITGLIPAMEINGIEIECASEFKLLSNKM